MKKQSKNNRNIQQNTKNAYVLMKTSRRRRTAEHSLMNRFFETNDSKEPILRNVSFIPQRSNVSLILSRGGANIKIQKTVPSFCFLSAKLQTSHVCLVTPCASGGPWMHFRWELMIKQPHTLIFTCGIQSLTYHCNWNSGSALHITGPNRPHLPVMLECKSQKLTLWYCKCYHVYKVYM